MRMHAGEAFTRKVVFSQHNDKPFVVDYDTANVFIGETWLTGISGETAQRDADLRFAGIVSTLVQRPRLSGVQRFRRRSG